MISPQDLIKEEPKFAFLPQFDGSDALQTQARSRDRKLDLNQRLSKSSTEGQEIGLILKKTPVGEGVSPEGLWRPDLNWGPRRRQWHKRQRHCHAWGKDEHRRWLGAGSSKSSLLVIGQKQPARYWGGNNTILLCTQVTQLLFSTLGHFKCWFTALQKGELGQRKSRYAEALFHHSAVLGNFREGMYT